MPSRFNASPRCYLLWTDWLVHWLWLPVDSILLKEQPVSEGVTSVIKSTKSEKILELPLTREPTRLDFFGDQMHWRQWECIQNIELALT